MPRSTGARILEARTRCARAHDQAGGGEFIPFVWLTADHAEQRNHGITDYALSAWCDFRSAHPGPIRRARGTVTYAVPGLKPGRMITCPALILEAADKTTLALTGCTWGYGGEGPHGSALILADAGFFLDLDRALDYVAGLEGGAPWELNHPEGGAE